MIKMDDATYKLLFAASRLFNQQIPSMELSMFKLLRLY